VVSLYTDVLSDGCAEGRVRQVTRQETVQRLHHVREGLPRDENAKLSQRPRCYARRYVARYPLSLALPIFVVFETHRFLAAYTCGQTDGRTDSGFA